MIERYPQGRIKILSYSKSSLDLIYSWPNADKIIQDDPELLINLTLIWYYVDQNQVRPNQWSEDTLMKIANEWIRIPANGFVDATVKKFSLQFLASLIQFIWEDNLNIHRLRQFKMVIKKAAVDFESTTVAGFLKTAVVKMTTKPQILSFNGSVRKTTEKHFACSIMIVNRSRASSQDVENFFALRNDNGGIDLKVSLLNRKTLIGDTEGTTC